MYSDSKLAEIFDRMNGHCHFCGDLLIFDKYGKNEAVKGAWEIDHVIQKGKGGPKDRSNCLAACIRCNRLRWYRSGQEIRDLLLCGLIAKDEIKKGTQVGKTIQELKKKRLNTNIKRRRKVGK